MTVLFKVGKERCKKQQVFFPPPPLKHMAAAAISISKLYFFPTVHQAKKQNTDERRYTIWEARKTRQNKSE